MEKPDISPEDEVLIIIREELYEGCWEEMLEDLEERLAGKPYVLRLAGRIEDDIGRIGRLRAIEKKKGINLADYLDGRECEQ